MSTIIILEPGARGGIAAQTPWRPLDTLRGKVVGFIDNSKPNFHHLADDLAQILIDRHGAASVVRHRKLSASIPAGEDVYADIADRCDLVITGSGD